MVREGARPRVKRSGKQHRSRKSSSAWEWEAGEKIHRESGNGLMGESAENE